jgi:2-oxoisovalerate dehydrogenase E1 component alpha subunit
MMPHSSSDDHYRYRSREELEEERRLDPIPRFRDYLLSIGLLEAEDDRALWARVDAETEEAISYAESAPLPAPESALERLYAP